MDAEYEKLKAQVEALQSAILVLGKENPGIQQKLRTLFHREYNEAKRQADRDDTIDTSQVRLYPRESRNREAEQAKVEVYLHLARVLGAEI
ncbi:MAG: hypothetical protein ACN6QT_07095 [Burkholderia contaminans]|uniref:Uncharacterized protein n=1 Tax=Burkholderia contaminans TaxID=488447 RepID=A0AAP4QYU6_9BURK|nr:MULTISPECIES: hypothetical protein [Burkholderia]MBD1410542.1 hypothetical protein [Burkholderia contaminans]MBM6427370.1 hypothetical protein [Burkholderia contaminans]MCA7875653.1 hypothetical protein [Burkholderia contaminans]MDN7564353.1 hypothetical protein [Burkholderia contaminans]MDN8024104.1 hypothetical protein [Burkholderia contaminans]